MAGTVTSEKSLPSPSAEAGTAASEVQRAHRRRSATLIGVVAVLAVLVLAILGLAISSLLQPDAPTERWRDIFIILVALESLVIGIALVVLLVQLASLINLLQNEIGPILSAATETINTLRGTTEFLGESVVEPVIKLNGYMASLRRVLELMRITKK